MAIIISKQAKKILNRSEVHVEKVKPVHKTGTLVPSTNDPNSSVLAALWALPGRPGQTLMIVKRATGRTYRVICYNPVTRVMGLASEELAGHTFDAPYTEDAEARYTPLWR
jgi:hypothetical protein